MAIPTRRDLPVFYQQAFCCCRAEQLPSQFNAHPFWTSSEIKNAKASSNAAECGGTCALLDCIPVQAQNQPENDHHSRVRQQERGDSHHNFLLTSI